ncbi:MAG: hypothetical protein ABIG39_03360, partial [Candidatus Micrarchaeota archaeon]
MKQFAVLLLALFLLGCPFLGGGGPGQTMNDTNVTANGDINYTCYDGSVVSDPKQCPFPDLCPSSCEDGDPCTDDICWEETGFECVHSTITPCCGNGFCENGESSDSCLQDCGSCPESCDDDNVCSLDYCNTTSFNCVHPPIDGNVMGCNGYLGASGYSNVIYQFGLDIPDGWTLNESQSIRGIKFSGPMDRSNCTELSFFEKGYYSNPKYLFSVSPKDLWTLESSEGWEGVIFRHNNGLMAYMTSAPTIEQTVNRYTKQIRAEL